MASLLERIAQRLRSGRPYFDMADDGDGETPFPPASADQLAAAEAELGLALPTLLREIYLQIGNGGFGPGYGLLGVTSGATDDREQSLQQVYAEFRRTTPGLPSPWPERLLPICYNGCGIYDCLDCSKPQGQIYYYEPNIPGDGPYGCVLEPHFGSLEEWLEEWLREDDPFKRVSTTVDLGGKKPRAFDHTSKLLEERARRRKLGPQGYSINRIGNRETGRCECCGQPQHVTWGAVRQEKEACAAYFVYWTAGHAPEHRVNIDLILGNWSLGSSAASRCAVSLEYRCIESGSELVVIDANTRDIARNELVGRALARGDVIRQPISRQVFAVCEAVLVQDERLDALQLVGR